MLRSIPKTRPNGLKQFGIVNPPQADKRSGLYESISKSGQNRSQKTFYAFFNNKKIRINFILLVVKKISTIF
jgi:hypothetical protein